jgi:hypothetical protein
MKQTLKVDIECGEKTCASEAGKFCEFFGSIKFGQVPVCTLFPSGEENRYSPHTILVEKDGWTQRCTKCLDSGL